MLRHPRRRSFGLSDIGRVRPTNEDAFVADDTLGLYVVADGVGGEAKGEVASAEAVEQVRSFIGSSWATVEAYLAGDRDFGAPAMRRLLESAVQSACYMVYGMAEQDPEGAGMSTTLSALLLAGDLGVIAQVGDSRVYRMRTGAATQLTEDHTIAQHRIKLGLLAPGEELPAEQAHAITRAVGHLDYVEVDTFAVTIEPGDRYLLCSDGLHGCLEAGEVEQLLAAARVEDAARRAIDLANLRGGRDNVTAVVVALS